MVTGTGFWVFPESRYLGHIWHGFFPGTGFQKDSVSDSDNLSIPFHSLVTSSQSGLRLILLKTHKSINKTLFVLHGLGQKSSNSHLSSKFKSCSSITLCVALFIRTSHSTANWFLTFWVSLRKMSHWLTASISQQFPSDCPGTHWALTLTHPSSF